MSNATRPSNPVLSEEQIKRYIDSKEAEHCPRCEGTDLDFGGSFLSEDVLYEPRICRTCNLDFKIKSRLKGLSYDSFEYQGQTFNIYRPEEGKPEHMPLSEFLSNKGLLCPVCREEAIRDTSEYNCIGHTFFYSFECHNDKCHASWEAYYKTEAVFAVGEEVADLTSAEPAKVRSTSVGPKTAKRQAKACKSFLAEKEVDLQLSECQEMVAQAVHGARNWSTLLGGNIVSRDDEFIDDETLPINFRRANWAFESLVAFGDLTGVHPDKDDSVETASALKELLVNLRHLSERMGLDFHDIDDQAEEMFGEECLDDDDNGLVYFRENGFKESDIHSVLAVCNDPVDIIDKMAMVSDDGILKVEWTDLGEGMDGDYNEDDPDDIPLLRFDVSAKECEKTSHLFMDPPFVGEYGAVHDASYCTRMPVDTDPEILVRSLSVILRECHDAVDGGGQIKKVCERMSWLGPDDFNN